MLTNKPALPPFRPSPTRHLLPLGAMIFSGLSLAQTPPAAGESASATDNTLPTINVSAKKEDSTNSYRATKTRVGKTLQDPQDVPQAITTVTGKLMEEQQVGTLKEALRNVSGLTFNAAEGGRSGDNMMLRGFYTFGDIYLDGIRDTAQYSRDTFDLEQVDVLRGSAAMLFGRGQGGGVINQVSKTARHIDANEVSTSVGSNGYLETKGDFNKALGETSGLRLNVMKRDENSARSNPASGTRPALHRQGIAGSFATGLGTANELVLNYLHTTANDIPDYGVSFDGSTHRVNTKFSADDYWGIGSNFDDSTTDVATATYTHRFDQFTEWRTTLRSGDYQRAYWAKTPSATLAPSADGSAGGNQARSLHYKTRTLQSDYATRANAFGMKHELLTGVEYLHEENRTASLLNQGTSSAPFYTPDVTGNASTFHANSYAVYGQDTVEFVRDWKFLLGTRRDEMRAMYSSATSPALNYDQTSWRSGLSWEPSEDAHYYLSYSDAFSPTADLYQLTTTPYPPERSKTAELGAKWQFFDGDLSFRTALYSTTKNWERNNDLESTASILTKKRRTNGLEFELAGRITEAWEVFSGIALMNSKILEVAENTNATTGVVTSADSRLHGQRSRNTPSYTFNLWTTYKLAPAWKVGGGVEAKGKRYVYQPSTTNASSLFDANGNFTPNTAPGYQRWDAMLAYEQPTWAVRLNLRNIFDKVYYDALYDNGGFAVPGPRRSFIVTAEYKF